MIDLPHGVKPDSYNMTFENGILKIEFEKEDTQDNKSRKLEFKEKKYKDK